MVKAGLPPVQSPRVSRATDATVKGQYPGKQSIEQPISPFCSVLWMVLARLVTNALHNYFEEEYISGLLLRVSP